MTTDLAALIAACRDTPLDQAPWGVLRDCLLENDLDAGAEMARQVLMDLEAGLVPSTEEHWCLVFLNNLIAAPAGPRTQDVALEEMYRQLFKEVLEVHPTPKSVGTLKGAV